MSTYVYENWFDYEMNGKMPLSLLESQFNEEYDNFVKMMNAIDICNESGVVTISLNENAAVEKIKVLIEKFVAYLKSRIKYIKEIILQKLLKKSKNEIKESEYSDKKIQIPRVYILNNTNGNKIYLSTNYKIQDFKNLTHTDKIKQINPSNYDDSNILYNNVDIFKEAISILDNIEIQIDNENTETVTIKEFLNIVDYCTDFTLDIIEEQDYCQRMLESLEKLISIGKTNQYYAHIELQYYKKYTTALDKLVTQYVTERIKIGRGQIN